MNRFFRFFEKLGRPFDRAYAGRPPAGGLNFIRHFASQTPVVFTVMLILGCLTAFIEASIFMFVGWVVDMMNGSSPAKFFEDNFTTLVLMGLFVAVLRPIVAVFTAVLEEQIVVPEFFNLVRWQSHNTIMRQDVSFFDDEMAGRVVSKVWQGGQSTGDFLINLLQIIWFILVFAVTTLVVIASLDWRMMVPVLFWLGLIGLIAFLQVPKIRNRSRAYAEEVAILTGRIVDTYSNIRTVKLHANENAKDRYIRDTWASVMTVMYRYSRAIATMRIASQVTSSIMLAVITATALWLFSTEALSAGEVAVVLTLCLRLSLLTGRLLGLLNGLFRNFGTVQNSAALISKAPKVLDREGAGKLPKVQGEVEFKEVCFAYAGTNIFIDNFNLKIPAGQKIGIVGQSGVGKTTLMNLLLRFHDLEDGSIAIDGTGVESITQDSLRGQIGIVTQDSSLLHRSITDNIGYGKSAASRDEIAQAAKRANADEFIAGLKDVKGRTGYDTHVGERGVKLSGGQRQRIALARVFLKDAPILLLDEATSALDTEIEAAIQENLVDLMEGKTVIAIAHRLSTIAHLDRLIVMEAGKIVEDGTHDELLKSNGLYARLWKRQSGGFLAADNAD